MMFTKESRTSARRRGEISRCRWDAGHRDGYRSLQLELLEDRQLLDAALGHDAVALWNASPALFTANEGQWADESIRYALHGTGMNVLHTDGGPVIELLQDDPRDLSDGLPATEKMFDLVGKHVQPPHRTEVTLSFDGAQHVEPVGLDPSQAVDNFFVGDQSNWRSQVATYATVGYLDLYDGVDLYTWGRQNSLKYEFRVAPGADYRQIQLSYDGIKGLWLDDAGDLHVQTELGELIDDAPYVYQMVDGQQQEVASEFTLIDGDTFTFDVTGAFDPTQELVIDPELEWSTYVTRDDRGMVSDVAVDREGDILIYQHQDLNSENPLSITKISADGAHVWTTYFGSDSTYDYGDGLAVDAQGNVVATGYTWGGAKSHWVSGGYITQKPASVAGNPDAFVIKLNPEGQHQWSTLTHNDKFLRRFGRDIAVDSNDDILVTGHQTPKSDIGEGFVLKISSDGQQPLWSTSFGGTTADYSTAGFGIATDSLDNVLVTGSTSSDGWASGGFDTRLSGDQDAFVAKLDSDGVHQWSSYLGGPGREEFRGSDAKMGIAIDSADSILMVSETDSADWLAATPENPWQQNGFDVEYNGGTDAFVVKLSAAGAGLWGTYLGGDQDELGEDIAVDGEGNAIVVGSTYSDGWVAGGFDLTLDGASDGFVARLSPDGGHVWSTYLGGANGESARGIALDPAGDAIVAGDTTSPNWSTDGSTLDGTSDGFVAKIHLGPPAPGIQVTPSAGLETSEDNGEASFDVVLRTEPSEPVTIDVSSSDATEGTIVGATDNVLTLTFDAGNWSTSQTVTVLGVEDNEQDGDQAYTVVLAAAVSGDDQYNGIDPADVSVTNLDNDAAPVSPTDIYVWDIGFLTKTRGINTYLQIVVDVNTDFNADGAASQSDAATVGAEVTVELRNSSGLVGTYTGVTDSQGIFESRWIRGLAPGNYTAEVVDVVLADYSWNHLLDNEDDSDGDGWPDDEFTLQ